MSGKTTLRTVGINLVLAQAGSFVCAKEMTFSPLTPMIMRIVDDLNEGIYLLCRTQTHKNHRNRKTIQI